MEPLKTREKHKDIPFSHSYQGRYTYLMNDFFKTKRMKAHSSYPPLPSEFDDDSQTFVCFIKCFFFHFLLTIHREQ